MDQLEHKLKAADFACQKFHASDERVKWLRAVTAYYRLLVRWMRQSERELERIDQRAEVAVAAEQR